MQFWTDNLHIYYAGNIITIGLHCHFPPGFKINFKEKIAKICHFKPIKSNYWWESLTHSPYGLITVLKFGMQLNVNLQDLFCKIGYFCSEFHPFNYQWNFQRVLNSSDLSNWSLICVNWMRFKAVLKLYFSYIWGMLLHIINFDI